MCIPKPQLITKGSFLIVTVMFYVFFTKTDKGFDKATFENQMSVMRGQVRLHFNIISFVTTSQVFVFVSGK